jgi:hypothetical protein
MTSLGLTDLGSNVSLVLMENWRQILHTEDVF